MHYCKNLEFTQEPDYNYLKRIFRELYIRQGFENDFIFDWTIQRYHPELTQYNFGLSLDFKGPRSGGGSEASKGDQNENDKISMENRYPISEDGIPMFPSIDP